MSTSETAPTETPEVEAAPAGPLDPAHAAIDKVAAALDKMFLGRREDRGELTAWVEPEGWVAAARLLRDETPFKILSDLTAVDYLDRDPRFDLSIIVTSMEHHSCLRLKTMISEENCTAPTLIGVWSGANWYEREVFDLFGIKFDKHPNMRRILLPADYNGHPLRKDYPVTGPATSAYR